MKYIFIIAFLMPFVIKAQHCSEDINTEPGSTINVYDWTQEQYSDIWIVNTNNPGGGSVEVFPKSPFYYDDEDQNISHLFIPIIKDFLPEDGWELVAKKFGSAGPSSNGVTIPSFVLYNRYEAQLHAFFYIPESLEAANGFNKAKITLKFEGTPEPKESSLLAPVKTPLKALENFETGLNMVASNYYDNGGDYWLYAAFPVYYDPCTCEHFTQIIIDPDLLEVQDIVLEMTGGGIITEVVSGSAPQSNGFSSLFNGINDGVKKGNKVSKTLDGFYNFAEKVGGVVQAFDVATSSSGGMSEAEKKDYDKKVNNSFKFPKWTKDIPNIGVAFGVAEWILGGGKSTAPTPSSFEAQFNFDITGNITTPNSFQGNSFFVPGSDWASNSNNEAFIPVYDNILGTFSVLEKLEVNYDIGLGEIPDPLPDDPNHTREGGPYALRFQLQSPLKYAINPASGLSKEPVDIKAALVIEGCDISSFNIGSNNTLGNPEASPFLKLVIDDVVRYQTPFLPLSCLNDYIAYLPDDLLIPGLCDDVKVFLKVAATLERDVNDVYYDSEASEVLFMAEYETTLTEGVIDDSNSELSNIKLTETVEDLTLTEDQTIYAWSTIYVGQNIVTNGNQLTLISGGEIIGDLSDISTDIDLLIGHASICEGTVPAQTPSEIATFCGGGLYDPTWQLVNDPESRESLEEESNQATFDLVASPNPFSNFIDLQYSNYESQPAEIIVTDALGKTITFFETDLNIGENQKLRIETHDWANGFYILTLKTENVVETIKLIKQ